PGRKGLFVDRRPEAVEHPAEERRADGDRGRVTGGPHRGAGPQAVEAAEGHADDTVAVEGHDLAADLAGGGENDDGVADGGIEAGHLEVDAHDPLDPAEAAGPGRLEGLHQPAGFDDLVRAHRSPSSAERTRSSAGPSWASIRESPTSRMQPPDSTAGSATIVTPGGASLMSAASAGLSRAMVLAPAGTRARARARASAPGDPATSSSRP